MSHIDPLTRAFTRSLIVALLVASFVAHGPAPAHAEYVWEQELYGSEIRDLATDGSTLYWATTAGLVEWDVSAGSYEVFRRDERTLPSDSLNVIEFDVDGNLWCGTDSEGIAIKLAGGGWTRVRTFDGLPSSRVLSIARDGNAMIVGTDQGFAEFTAPDEVRGSCTVIDPCVDDFPSLAILSIDAGPDATWYGTAGGPVRRVGDAFESILSGVGESAVNAVLTDATLGTWVGTEAGAFRLDPSTDTWLATTGLPGGADAFAIIDDGLVAGSGRLYLWTGTEWERYGAGFTPITPTKAIVQTDAGAVVAGTGRGSYTFIDDVWGGAVEIAGIPRLSGVWGVAVGPDSVWVSYRSASAAAVLGDAGWHPIDEGTSGGGFERAQVQGVHVDAAGNVWFAHCCCSTTDDEEDCTVDVAAPEVDSLPFVRRLNAVNVRSIVTVGTEMAFLGSGAEDASVNGAGLFVWTNALPADSAAVLTAGTSPLASDTVPALAMGNDDALWIGHRQNGLDVWSFGLDPLDGAGDQWVHYDEDATDVDRFIISNEVLSIAADGPRMWVGTANGVSLYENRDHRGSWGASTLGNPFVTAVAVTRDGSAWAGTPSGLVRFRPNALGTFDTERYDFPDLGNGRVFSLAADGNDVYVGTSRGLTVGRSVGPSVGGGGPLLGSAYPNPFDPSRHDGVRFVDVAEPVSGDVFDAAGSKVASFADVAPGDVVWRGGPDSDPSSPVAPGLYVIVARAEGRVLTSRVAVIR